MSDLFHKDVPEEFIRRVFDTMVRADWHQFQILTKRADRLEELSPRLPWPANVWQGVSVENADYAFRIDHLRRTAARGQVPVGRAAARADPGPRPDGHRLGHRRRRERPGLPADARSEWVTRIARPCEAAGVPLFFKQTGEKLARQMGFKSKKGGDAAEWPEELAGAAVPADRWFAGVPSGPSAGPRRPHHRRCVSGTADG